MSALHVIQNKSIQNKQRNTRNKAHSMSRVCVCAGALTNPFYSATLREREIQKIDLIIRRRSFLRQLNLTAIISFIRIQANQSWARLQYVTSCLCRMWTRTSVDGACTAVGCLLPRRCFTTGADSRVRVRRVCSSPDTHEDGGGRLLVDSPCHQALP